MASLNREKADELLVVLGKRLRQGEDALAFLTQISAMPPSPARDAAVKAAAGEVQAWMDGTAADVAGIVTP